jgi:signal transduction histidine kinase
MEDERFVNNPLVTLDPKMRYYCGAPLITEDGHRLGSLCVIDKIPRSLSDYQKRSLITLSKQVVKHFELKKQKLFLERQKQNLEKEVALRTTDLNEINNELKTFIYKSSHDIRGPLATIIGLSELGNVKTNDSEMQFYFKHIIDTGYRLDTTLRNLLKIVQLKDKPLDLSVVNSEKILEGISLIKGEYNDSKVKFLVTVTEGLNFSTDFDLFQTILKNLVDNSVKFSNEKDSFVSIQITSDDSFVKITVEDNGDGIEEEIKPRIFDMFFRGNEKSKGSGLGLFIVKKAVHKLEGKIDFSSALHKGSTFNIWIKKLLA